MEFVNPAGLRLDGRRPKELRRIVCELGTLAHADGSASLQMGNTKVLAAVFGPHEPTSRGQAGHDRCTVHCDYAMAAFSTGERRRRGKSDRRAAETIALLRAAIEQTVLLELMPRSQLDITVQVLQADGGERSACVNAIMLALAAAGVPLRDMVASCSAGFLESMPLLDLNHTEESGGGPSVFVVLHPKSEKVVVLQADSKLSVENVEAVTALAIDGCKAVAKTTRQRLLEHFVAAASARGGLVDL